MYRRESNRTHQYGAIFRNGLNLRFTFENWVFLRREARDTVGCYAPSLTKHPLEDFRAL